jgi:hypothetical protein
MADEPTPVQNTPEPVAPAPVVPVAVVPAAVVPEPAPSVIVKADEPAEPVVTPPAAPAPVVETKYDLKIGDEPVNPQLIEALTPFFKEANMTVKQAQGLSDAFLAHSKAMVPVIAQRNLDSLRADPELGKLNFGRTQARINDALSAFTSPQERARWETRGLANDPDFVHFFNRLGKAMQDAPQTEQGTQVREKLPTQSKLYGGKDRVQSN